MLLALVTEITMLSLTSMTYLLASSSPSSPSDALVLAEALYKGVTHNTYLPFRLLLPSGNSISTLVLSVPLGRNLVLTVIISELLCEISRNSNHLFAISPEWILSMANGMTNFIVSLPSFCSRVVSKGFSYSSLEHADSSKPHRRRNKILCFISVSLMC